MARQPLSASNAAEGWVSVSEAARRLSMSPSSFKEWAASEDGIEIVRRGRHPGVKWSSVEKTISRSRVRAVTHRLLRSSDPELPIHGVGTLDAARAKLGSDGQIARMLGVTAATVSRWRVDGVPDHRLRDLIYRLGLPAAELDGDGLTVRGRSVRRRGRLVLQEEQDRADDKQ
jgi:hypothetical protein